MEDLKSRLDFLIQIEAKEIIEEAKKQAEKIITDADARAEERKKREVEQITKNLKETETIELEAARSEQKRKMMNLKFELIDSAFAASLDKLKRIASEPALIYRNSLERLLVESVSQMTGSEFEAILSLNDVDHVKKRLEQITRKMRKIKNDSITLKISSEQLRSIGGVVVRSCDGKQIFNNTLEARLAKVRQESLPQIAKILFEVKA